MGLREQLARQTRTVLKKLGFRSLPGRFNGVAFNAPTEIASLVPSFLWPVDLAPEGREAFIEYAVQSLTDGDVVLDIGAGAGLATLMMARRVGRGGTIHAVEADPLRFETLRTLVSCNGMSNITLVPRAVGSAEGPATTTVDHLAAGLQRKPRAIMIDAQGSELDVLNGAKTTLAALDLVFCQIYPGQLLQRSGHKPRDVVELLAQSGLLQDKAFFPLSHVRDAAQPYAMVFRRKATLTVLQ